MPIESFDNKFNKQLTNKLQAQVEQVARIPLQNQQAALVKVNEVMASLHFPLGQKLNFPLGQSQSHLLQQLLGPTTANAPTNNRVLVNLVNNQLTITPTQTSVAEISLSNQHKQALVELALNNEANSSAVQGKIIHAQADENSVKFSLNNQTYQLSKSQLNLAKNNTGPVLLKLANNPAGSITIELLSPKNPQATKSNNKLELNQSQLISQLSQGKLSLPSGDIEIKQLLKHNLPNNSQLNISLNSKNATLELALPDGRKLEPIKLQQLATESRSRIEQTFKTQLAGINLIKPVTISDDGNASITIAGVKVAVNSAVEQKIPFVNVSINNGIAELTLSNGEKKQLVLPEKAILQNLITALSGKEGKSAQQLQTLIKALPKDLAVTIESALQKTQLLDKASTNNKFHLASTNEASTIKITTSAAGQINLPLNKEMLNQLKDWGWVSLQSETSMAKPQANKISDGALLQQLQANLNNASQNTSLNVSQQIKQLLSTLNHKNNALDVPLNQLMQLLNNQQIDLPSGLKSALTSLTTAIQQPDASQVKQQILEQVQLPQFSLAAQANIASNNSGLANALVSALQQIFMAKAKRTQLPNQVNPNKTTDKTSAAATGSSAATNKLQSSANTKLTQALAQSIRNMQNNQLHTAKSQIDNQNQLFATLPILGNEALQQLDLAIQIDTDAESNRADAVKMWRFSLKFNMGDLGNMLAKAVYVEGKLKINLYTETQKLLELGENNIQQLKENLSKLGILLEEYNFNLGKIPSQLWNESALSMQYRLV